MAYRMQQFRNAFWPSVNSSHQQQACDDEDIVLVKEELIYKDQQKEEENNKILEKEEKETTELVDNQEAKAYIIEEYKQSIEKVTVWLKEKINLDDDDKVSIHSFHEYAVDSDSCFTSVSMLRKTDTYKKGEIALKVENNELNQVINKSEANERVMNEQNDQASMIITITENQNRPVPWVTLKSKHNYNVNITEFNGEEFFVQLADENLPKQLKRLLKRVNLTPLQYEDIEPGDHCLVESNGEVHRAMIQFYNSDSTMAYSVDTGEIFYFNQNNPPIYKMPRKIRKSLSFQAIRCKFHGLTIRSNSQWFDYINSSIIRKIKKASIFIVSVLETDEDNTDPYKAMDEYTVILYDISGPEPNNINGLLIEKQLAEPIQ